MKKAIALVAIMSLLPGCQKLAYQPATGDDTATITFTSENLAVQPMICVPAQGFEPTEYAVSHEPFSSDFFTQLNESLKKLPEVETTIVAGTAVRVGFSYTSKEASSKGQGVRDRCKVALLFTPEAGASYKAHFSMIEEACAVQLTEQEQPVDSAVVAPWECQ